MTGNTHLSTWVSNEAKQRFARAAARQSVSESALLKRLVEQLLASATDDAAAPIAPPDPWDARLTVRLLPEDRALLRERAAARSMRAATYVSVLVRSHLRRLAPLPDRELSSLQASVRELAAVGRNLNTMARLPPTTELVTKAQLVARHPHLLSVNHVTWALRCRAVNGLSGAVFDSPCGELLIHEPSFLAWLLGLGGRAKSRAGRRAGRPVQLGNAGAQVRREPSVPRDI
jgi:hypothetical protein